MIVPTLYTHQVVHALRDSIMIAEYRKGKNIVRLTFNPLTAEYQLKHGVDGHKTRDMAFDNFNQLGAINTYNELVQELQK